MNESLLVKRINRDYAFTQGAYWLSEVGLGGYITVFLSYRGLDDTLIAFTTALLAIVSIVIQMVLSNYTDAHSELSLRRLITILYTLTIILSALLFFMKPDFLLLIGLFVVAASCQRSIESYLNAQMMQFVNIGLPVSYSWPRGVGSFAYASGAFILGKLFDQYNPNILLPISILFSVFGIITVLRMPNPTKLDLSAENLGPKITHTLTNTSYWQMLKSNSPLVLYFLASIACAVGMTGYNTFLVRIVEDLGGSNSQLGMAMFVQSAVELPAMFLAKKILKRIKPSEVLLISYGCFFLKGIAMAWVPNLLVMYLLMAFSFFCYGLYGFSSVLFVNEVVLPNEKIRAQSLSSLCFTGGIGGILGNAFAGAIVANHSIHYLLIVSQVFGLLSVVLMAVCVYLSRQKTNKGNSLYN